MVLPVYERTRPTVVRVVRTIWDLRPTAYVNNATTTQHRQMEIAMSELMRNWKASVQILLDGRSSTESSRKTTLVPEHL